MRGKHITTFGFQMNYLQDNLGRPTSGTSASFTFTNNDTAGFSPTGSLLTTTGNAYASYLLGAADAATITKNNVVWSGARYKDYSLFVQDDWRLTSKLTLNLGLRWDVFIPYSEQFNRVSHLDPSLANPAVGGFPGALVYASTQIDTHYRDFQPRVGFVYSLNSRTVIRSGFLMAYSHGAPGIGGNAIGGGPGRTGYDFPASYSAPTAGQPSFYWDQGVPPAAPQAFLTPGFGAGFTTSNPTGAQSVARVDPELSGRAPYYLNWNFGLQREISPSMTVGATYSASGGHFLPMSFFG